MPKIGAVDKIFPLTFDIDPNLDTDVQINLLDNIHLTNLEEALAHFLDFALDSTSIREKSDQT